MARREVSSTTTTTAAKTHTVTTVGGLRGEVSAAELAAAGRDGPVDVHLDDGRRLQVPTSLLRPQAGGGYLLPVNPDARVPDASAVTRADRAIASEETVVPVVHESLRVGKRVVPTGGVRVRKVPREEKRVVEQDLSHEEVVVERRPVNRVVTGPVAVRHTRDAIIVPLLQEVIVIQKRLVLREELVITKRTQTRRDRQQVTVRREEAVFERVHDADGTPDAPLVVVEDKRRPEATARDGADRGDDSRRPAPRQRHA